MLFLLSSPQENKLRGRYKIFFEEKYSSQNGIISFEGNSYKRTLNSKKTVSGTIEYKKYTVALTEANSYQILIAKSEIGNDSIGFSTIDLSKKVEDDLLINEGKLIRIK